MPKSQYHRRLWIKISQLHIVKGIYITGSFSGAAKMTDKLLCSRAVYQSSRALCWKCSRALLRFTGTFSWKCSRALLKFTGTFLTVHGHFLGSRAFYLKKFTGTSKVFTGTFLKKFTGTFSMFTGKKKTLPWPLPKAHIFYLRKMKSTR